MAIDVNNSFSVESGLSFNDSVFMFEGIDSPEVALADISIVVGSVYVKYGGAGNINLYQKTNHTPLTYQSFSSGGSPNLDGGHANTIYTYQVVDGGAA